MTKGIVSKIVKTFGSTWGRIRPDGDRPEVFFNVDSLAIPSDFASLDVGQSVEFEERRDLANGTIAENMQLVPAAAAVSAAT